MASMSKKERYVNLCHALQTGVGNILRLDGAEGTPKHLRTGLNILFCEHSALVMLLIEKGIFTEDEYFDSVNKVLAQEVSSYESKLSNHYKTNIRLV